MLISNLHPELEPVVCEFTGKVLDEDNVWIRWAREGQFDVEYEGHMHSDFTRCEWATGHQIVWTSTCF